MSEKKFAVTGVTEYELANGLMSVWGSHVSDGYHTMHELYQHRMALNIALFHAWHELSRVSEDTGNWFHITVGKSKLHHDGTMFEGGYFVVFALTPKGQITYHYQLKHWDEFKIPEYERVPVPYDGHSSLDVLDRLAQL